MTCYFVNTVTYMVLVYNPPKVTKCKSHKQKIVINNLSIFFRTTIPNFLCRLFPVFFLNIFYILQNKYVYIYMYVYISMIYNYILYVYDI